MHVIAHLTPDSVGTHVEIDVNSIKLLVCSTTYVALYYNSCSSIYTYVGSYVLYIIDVAYYAHYWSVAKHACSVHFAPSSGHMPIIDRMVGAPENEAKTINV